MKPLPSTSNSWCEMRPSPLAVQRLRRTRDVGAGVDQVLRQAIPSGVLGARELVEHAAELQANGAHVHVERRLDERLRDVAVVVVAAGVLGLGIQPIAEVLAAKTPRTTHFRRGDPSAPRAEVHARAAGGLFDELSCRLDARRLRIEIEVAADLRRAVDRRRWPADDVDPLGRADGRRIVARIVESPDAPEIGLAGRPADVEGAGDAEERLREAARRQRDQLVDVADVETRHHLVADGGRGTRRIEQRPTESEHRAHLVVRQAVEVGGDDQFLDVVVGVGSSGCRSGTHRGQSHEDRDAQRPTHGHGLLLEGFEAAAP